MLNNLALAGLAFLGMEGVAWITHKYLLHGCLWFLHRSHHANGRRAWERNDLFFVYFGALAMACFVAGSTYLEDLFWVGTGISIYGIAYFLVHDVFIHHRIKVFNKPAKNVYLRAVYLAHQVHHRSSLEDDTESFGLLWVPVKYLKLAQRNKKHL